LRLLIAAAGEEEAGRKQVRGTKNSHTRPSRVASTTLKPLSPSNCISDVAWAQNGDGAELLL
jgi:hypothetical protein